MHIINVNVHGKGYEMVIVAMFVCHATCVVRTAARGHNNNMLSRVYAMHVYMWYGTTILCIVHSTILAIQQPARGRD